MKTKIIYTLLLTLLFISGCSKDQQQKPVSNVDSVKEKKRIDSALTLERRNNLTIDEIIQQFKDGNKRFISNESIQYDYIKQVQQTGQGQFPKAIVLGCIDSRAPVEEVFDKSLGEIFGCRVAGNYADAGVLGGIEFACKLMGSKVIIVMGHTDCGAIKGACDNVKMGNLTDVMNLLKPAVDSVKGFDADRTSKNKDFVKAVTIKNVQLTMKNILDDSEIIAELVKEGKVKIVGVMYDVTNGKVDFLN